MASAIVIVLDVILFFLLATRNSLASSIILSDPNLEIISDFNQVYEVSVKLSVNAADGTKYYLRGLFFKSGTSKYCGYTWNGQSWYNGPFSSDNGFRNLPGISLSSDSAQILLKSKFDPLDNDCKEPGEYSFKIQRYTSAGSAIIDDQNEQKIKLEAVAPSLTLKPKNTSIPTKSKPQTSPLVSSNTPDPVRVYASPTTVKIQSLSPSKKVLSLTSALLISASVSASITSLNQSTAVDYEAKKHLNLTVIPLFVGIALIFASACVSFGQIKNFRN